jgi:hydroxymethylpyrimidine/phosphomethylpyrimidine kinase
MRPSILCFAGLDPCGGAGLQADIESISQCGGYSLPIATCLTVQNTQQVRSVSAVKVELIQQQVSALIQDIDIAA